MDDYINVGGVRSRDQVINLGAYWKRQKFFKDASGNVEYICRHPMAQPNDSDTDWEIWKLYYDVADFLEDMQGPIKGSVTGRAALDWDE